jgi:hypothetical protein
MAAIGTPYCLAISSSVSPGWTVWVAKEACSVGGSSVGEGPSIDDGVAEATIVEGPRSAGTGVGVAVGVKLKSGVTVALGGSFAGLVPQDVNRTSKR